MQRPELDPSIGGTDLHQTLTLRPSRVLFGALTAATALFTGLMIWLAVTAPSQPTVGLALFFGLFTAVIGSQLLPNAAWLRLTAEGFQLRTLHRSLAIVRWSDVAAFGS